MAGPPTSSWHGRIVLAREWMLYAGPVGATTPHAHHAFQIVAGDPVVLRDAAGEIARLDGAVVPPHVEHAFVEGGLVALVYVDPESRAGRQLRARIGTSARVSEWRASVRLPSSAPDEPHGIVRGVLTELLGDVHAHPRATHRALRRALEHIDETLPGRIRLDALSRASGVSGGHLAHLFRDELGTTIRAFVLWARLARAARAFQGGRTIAEAAHAAGFADAAHLTRTFRRMFGLAPSELLGASWTVAGD